MRKRKLKVVKIARHCCIRVQKMALPLMEEGYEVHCISHRIPSYADRYETLSLYQDVDQLYSAIRLHPDADIFHCHNEPNWFVSAVKSVFPNKPVVLDMHDSMLIRVAPEDESQNRISVDERNNAQLADALVFVSDPMAVTCRREYGLEQPFIILPSYVPKGFYKIDPWKWLGGITYEGRIDLPEEIGTEELKFFSYCDYKELAKALAEKQIPFHLYTPRKDGKIQEAYKGIAHWRGSYPFDDLIRKLGRHNWGIIGNLQAHLAWQAAMPNKLFEYLAAGIPVIALNASEGGKFLDDTGMGINVNSVDEIVARWTEHRKCREKVFKHRHEWSMERHIHLLEELYEKII